MRESLTAEAVAAISHTPLGSHHPKWVNQLPSHLRGIGETWYLSNQGLECLGPATDPLPEAQNGTSPLH